LRSTGIMAETEPKIAKQKANAPVPNQSCRVGLEGRSEGVAINALLSCSLLITDGMKSGCDLCHAAWAKDFGR
jgi:hypothetical protein